MSALERFIAYRRSLKRPPSLAPQRVKARGLDFAVYTTPAADNSASRMPPLLCVNGGMLFDHRLLWPALSPLADDRQLIFYDQRGRGKSSVPPGVRGARIEHDAGDLRAIREAMGIERWDVLGHSWGGGISMLGAQQDPEGVRKLVLVNAVGPTSSWMAGMHDDALQRLAPHHREVLRQLDPVTLETADPAIQSEYARAIYPAWFASPELSQLLGPPRSESLTGATVLARLRRDGYDWTSLVRALHADVVVIHGASDLLPVTVARELVEVIPKSRLVVIPEAGHMPFWEAPEEFFGIVDAFLLE